MKQKKLITLIIFTLLSLLLLCYVMDRTPFLLSNELSRVKCFIVDVSILFTVIVLLFYVLFYRVKKDSLVFPILSLIVSIAIVFFCYFWQSGDDWNLSNNLSFIEVLIGFLSIIIVIVGGYIAIKQLKSSIHANMFSSFQFMIRTLQAPKARENRKIIFRLYDESTKIIKPLNDWTEEEHEAAQSTLASMDLIGLLVKNRLLDYSFLEGWSYSIYKILYILEEAKSNKGNKFSYITKENKIPQSDYFLGVDELIRLKNSDKIYDFESSLQEDNQTL